MTFVDTNVWVYALTEQDHAKKKKAAERKNMTWGSTMPLCLLWQTRRSAKPSTPKT